MSGGCGRDRQDTELSATVKKTNQTDTATETDTVTETVTEQITEPEDKSFHIKMTFAGDCMLASYCGQYYKDNFAWYAKNMEPEYFFANTAEFFKKDDFTLVNLENVLTDRDLAETAKNYTPAYWYKGPTENTRILIAAGVEAVSLSNNHTMDYGIDGDEDTKKAVDAAGLQWGNAEKTLYFEKNGFTAAIICNGLWQPAQANVILSRLKQESQKSDYQIVFFHGGTERLHAPEEWKVKACRSMVDAGADLVIGSHPHVLQPEEIYNDVHIIYSMANFCYGGSDYPENRTVLYSLDLLVDDGKVMEEKTDIIPYYVYTGAKNNYQPAKIINEKEKNQVLAFMQGKVKSPF